MTDTSPRPLDGFRVLELEGIGPGPLGACVLADFGADVVSVSRVGKGGRVRSQGDPVSRGKRSIALDLKAPRGKALLREMVRRADCLIEPFRPGVMEKLGLGPDVLLADNPRLIYARMTGWGQTGDPRVYTTAGHDANYLAVSGALDLFRRGDETPLPPANFAGDYAGGGMMLAMGVLLAAMERLRSGRGQVVDVAMTDGANYVALPLYKWLQTGMLPRHDDTPNRHLDPHRSFLHQGPPWSNTYACADGEWLAVQAIEPQFYKALLKGMGLDEAARTPGALPHQHDRESWGWMKARFAAIFTTKTRDEWAEIFTGTDACAWPVLTASEAARHPHNVARGSFAPSPGRPGEFEPVPAPRLVRTPGHLPRDSPQPAAHTRAVLREYGVPDDRVEQLLADKVCVDTAAAAASPRAKL